MGKKLVAEPINSSLLNQNYPLRAICILYLNELSAWLPNQPVYQTTASVYKVISLPSSFFLLICFIYLLYVRLLSLIVCIFVYPSNHPSFYLSLCIHISVLSICLFIHPSISLCLSLCLPTFRFTSFLYLLPYVSVLLLINPSSYLSIYPSPYSHLRQAKNKRGGEDRLYPDQDRSGWEWTPWSVCVRACVPNNTRP